MEGLDQARRMRGAREKMKREKRERKGREKREGKIKREKGKKIKSRRRRQLLLTRKCRMCKKEIDPDHEFQLLNIINQLIDV